MTWVLILFAALCRALPHPFNVTPVGAIGLFAGANLPRRIAWAVPLVALLAGDLFLGFYDPVVMVSVYLGMALAAPIGRVLLKKEKRKSLPRFVGAVAGASLTFFFVSNFGVWLASGHGGYPRTLAGLLECYAMGVPFFWRTLLGDGLYTVVLFGLQALVALREGEKKGVTR